MRHITRETLLYTEMTMDNTLLHNPDKLENFIGYSRDIEPRCNDPSPARRGRLNLQDIDQVYIYIDSVEIHTTCSSFKLTCGVRMVSIE